MSFERFPPIATADARLLILGSLPGTRSLVDREYYAQPQNAFWRIMDELFGVGRDLAYDARIRRLSGCGIALWDVIASAERPGSLDSSIVGASIVVNDFPSLFARCPEIRSVFFNGAKATELFERRVRPTLDGEHSKMTFQRLPSTSAAHAAIRYEEKLESWKMVKAALSE